MKPKKYPEKDLRKRSIFFLQTGLIVVLLLSYFMINFKSYTNEESFMDTKVLGEVDEIDIPITRAITPEPPRLPPVPKSNDVVKVIEDDINEPTDIISPTDEPAIYDFSDITEATPTEDVESVPFKFIEDVPIYPGCEKFTDNENRRSCMSEKVKDFVSSNFNTNIGNEVGLTGINKVYVMFNIDKYGMVTDVQTRAPHPKLEQEALRVIKMLPNFEPGKQRGKPVSVSYTLPIVFQIQN